MAVNYQDRRRLMSQNFAMMTPEMQEQQIKQTGFKALAGQAEKLNKSINYALMGIDTGRLEPTSELLDLLKAKKMIYEILMPISDELTKFSRDLQKAINNAGGENKKQPAKKTKPKAKPEEPKKTKAKKEAKPAKSSKAEEPAEQKSDKVKPVMPEVEEDFVIN
jgi:chemotaxis protein histidine kinase CheA